MKKWTIPLGTLLVFVALLGGAGRATTASLWIVFAASPENGNGTQQLFRVRADGTGLRPITSGVRVATAPSLSPNGKTVVFSRLGSGLFVVNIDALLTRENPRYL